MVPPPTSPDAPKPEGYAAPAGQLELAPLAWLSWTALQPPLKPTPEAPRAPRARWLW